MPLVTKFKQHCLLKFVIVCETVCSFVIQPFMRKHDFQYYNLAVEVISHLKYTYSVWMGIRTTQFFNCWSTSTNIQGNFFGILINKQLQCPCVHIHNWQTQIQKYTRYSVHCKSQDITEHETWNRTNVVKWWGGNVCLLFIGLYSHLEILNIHECKHLE